MTYDQMVEMLENLQARGGFSQDEPLSSAERIRRSGGEIQQYEMSSYSLALAAVKEWARAVAVARSIEDADERGQALGGVASRMAESGLLKGARFLAQSIPVDPRLSGALVERVGALLKVIDQLIKAGDHKRASELLRQVEEDVKKRNENWDALQADFLAQIGEFNAMLGDEDRAVRLWEEAASIAIRSIEFFRDHGTPDVESARILGWIVQQFARHGYIDRASSFAESVRNPFLRERMLKGISIDGDR